MAIIANAFKKLLFNRVKKTFKTHYGSDMPIKMEDFDSLMLQHKQHIAMDYAVYNMVSRMFINAFGNDEYNSVLVKSIAAAEKDIMTIQNLMGDLAQTIAIMQGMKMAENETENIENANPTSSG